MSKEQMTNGKALPGDHEHGQKDACRRGLITEEEYRQIDTMFLAKYRPPFRHIMLRNLLTLQPFRVMYGSGKERNFMPKFKEKIEAAVPAIREKKRLPLMPGCPCSQNGCSTPFPHR